MYVIFCSILSTSACLFMFESIYYVIISIYKYSYLLTYLLTYCIVCLYVPICNQTAFWSFCF